MSFIHSSWAVAGFNFHKSKKHYENTVAHILSLKDVEIFRKSRRIEYSLSDIYQLSIGSHSEQVKKNRVMLTHLMSISG
jgi:hypothetical protein